MKKLIETILIAIHERKEARLYRKWIRALEDERHTRMIMQAEQLASRPAYRPTAVNDSVIAIQKVA